MPDGCRKTPWPWQHHKEKHLIGTGLQYRSSVNYHGGKHGRYGAGGVRDSTFRSAGNREKTPSLAWAFWSFKAHPEGHTSFNEATPTPTKTDLLISPLLMSLCVGGGIFYSSYHVGKLASLSQGTLFELARGFQCPEKCTEPMATEGPLRSPCAPVV